MDYEKEKTPFQQHQQTPETPPSLPPPPPYEAATQHAEEADAHHQHRASALPPTINGYFSWTSASTVHLGPTRDARTHALKIHSTLFSSRRTLALHAAGPDTSSAVPLARVHSKGCRNEFSVEVPGDDAVIVWVRGVKTGRVSEAARFEVDVGGGEGGGGRREVFEWRTSRGEDVKEVGAGGLSFGWKLVRLDGPEGAAPPVVEESGGGGRRGVASGGGEVVAVVAHNASLSATKGLRFAFLGSGLAGAFGELWEVVALASGLRLWYQDFERLGS
ncbi:hypothetical protein SLS58_007138 [Diplodia intermedia]|uniref:Uncharacterized protein n=1 Tax=Diplodia intermedia TaxID=856260 RepID=A0ABR3TKV9_9PEZI